MKGTDIRHLLEEQMQPQHRFVRWWRKENDFLDYDLVERFRGDLDDNDEIGGVELLTFDEMWRELKRVGGERIRHGHDRRRGEVVEWIHEEGGQNRTEVYPYTAEAILDIYDAETRDNPVC